MMQPLKQKLNTNLPLKKAFLSVTQVNKLVTEVTQVLLVFKPQNLTTQLEKVYHDDLGEEQSKPKKVLFV